MNNVETLAQAGHILAHGAASFRGLGHGAPGTKLFSLSGDVLQPGLHELPMGTTLRELVLAMVAACSASAASRRCSPAGPPTRC